MGRSTQRQWFSLQTPRHRQSVTPKQAGIPYSRRLRIEPLEDRRLLAVVTVDTLSDTVNFSDGVTSLREAIFAANTVDGADTIEFAAALTSGGPVTILLTQGELKITESLAINGPGADLLTIDASGNDPTPDVNNGNGSRVFNIDDGASGNLRNVSIGGLVLTGGDVTGSGGAILTRENLSLFGSTISNSASFGGGGGGIFQVAGELTVVNCTIRGNSAIGANPFAVRGGGILSNGNLSVIASTIISNSSGRDGGGIFSGGNTTVVDSNLSSNSSGGSGGAIFARGNLIVDRSLISENVTTAGGNAGGAGIYCYSGASLPNSLTVRDSSITNNMAVNGEGGGIRKLFGSLVIERAVISGNTALGPGGGVSAANGGVYAQILGSTISGNSSTGTQYFAGGGGLFFYEATASIVSSTIGDNTAAAYGGGIYSYLGPLTVVASTLSGNSAGKAGGGIRMTGNSDNSLSHTIVAGNSSGVAFTPSDVEGDMAVAFSLLGVDTGATITDNGGNFIGTAAAAIDPLLGPLADNGGPTLTHALLAGSPAINAGSLSAVAGVGGVPAFDQRGTPFGRVFNGRIDIGAFEYQAASDLNLVVDTLADESDGNYALGDLSLREALLLANTYPSTDSIHFAPALSGGTILLTLGELSITRNTSIVGLGADLLTIDASGNDPTPDMNNGDGSRVFNINDGTSVLRTVSIGGLTLTGGDASGAGGAIFASENLTVADSVVTGNATTSSAIAGGGGIYSRALTGSANTLTVRNSVITDNEAVSSEGGGIRKRFGRLIVDGSTISGNVALEAGGGISAAEGNVNVQISSSTVSDNHVTGLSSSYDVGGGLLLFFANTTITGSTISGNSAVDGGGIYSNGGSLSVIDTTIDGNSTNYGDGGGIFSRDGRLTVTGSAISGNVAGSTTLFGYPRGGGIYHRGNSNARLTVTSSTIEGNSAKLGGGIYGHFTTVTGSTISGNTAGNGGGIVARYNLSMASSTIEGNTAGREGGGIWTISAAMTVTGSTISGNSATNRGGGIYGGNTTVIGSTISDNSAGRGGGGIAARYNLFVTSSTISGNSSGREGGGILRLTFGNTTITDSTISGNSASGDGGGISSLSYYSSPDSLTVINSTISSNSSGRDGGGIWKGNSGALTVTESTIIDNSAVRDGGGILGGGTITTSSINDNSAGGSGGGISNGSGTLTVTASSIERNTASLGAGIFNASGNVTVTESTISANRASGNGGAVFARGAGSVAVVNSTISGNSSTGSAGGLYLFGTGLAAFTLRHSTIAFNSTSGLGGGVFLVAGPLSLDHTILATNTALLGPDVTAMGGSVLSARYSLIGTNAGSGLAAAPVGVPDANGNLIGGPGNTAINPLLAPLLDNGGPTLTHALFVGSPALDAGDPSAANGSGIVPAVDQRGAPFVRVFGSRIDIGSYERQSVSGLELIVSTLADVSNGDYSAGDFSLREAIGLANGSVQSFETISFADALTAGGPATIMLMRGELKIADALSIVGPGADLLTIDASGNDPTPDVNNGDGSRVFNIDDGLVFPIPQQVQNVAIGGLTLTGGDVTGDGGAIRNRENLTVTDSTISGNSAIGSGVFNPSAVRGGGIYSSGNLSVARSTINGNSVTGRGGGIWNYSGFGNNFTVTDSTFNGNSATNTGGGIESSGTTRVTNSTFSGNSAGYGYGGGGGIRSATGALTITGSTISGNTAHSGSGGGISGSAGSNLKVTDSTVSGNSAGSNGGGIYGFFVTATNSTISGNSAGSVGGGIYSNLGIVTITSSTISGNSAAFDGGGIRSATESRYGRAVLTHAIVAGNTQGIDQTPNDAVGIVTMSFSLLGVNTGATITNSGGNLIGTAAVPIDPLLGPLANNGGRTKTHALLVGSLAINAGDPSAVAGIGGVPFFDQRGGPFGRIFNGRIDIGAFESQPIPPAFFGDYNGNGTVDAADYSVWRNTQGTIGLAPYQGADGSGNGTVGPEDYQVWKKHFGETLPPPAAGNGAAAISFSEPIAAAGKSFGPETATSIAVPHKAMADSASVATFTLFESRSANRESSSQRPERNKFFGAATAVDNNLLLTLAIDRLRHSPQQESSEIDGRRNVGTHVDAFDSQCLYNNPLAVALAEWQ